ncbi:MAPK kinase substrate protein At1g80180 [Arachis duranensis]|uniref:MAPK kinase substrate protein At1g80180 n=2 Tax=Arachis TaxID=3817 RepID=A0A9C6T5J9_ARADU|nr:MAPK kinase substrate protein At1g80180 [Arachis duranensis]
MAGLGLQRSAVSFRRQGSSGFVWDDKFLSEEINKAEAAAAAAAAGGGANNNQQDNKDLLHQDASSAAAPPLPQINTVQRSRSNGGGARGYRTGKVSPAIEPPSPKLSACGFCAAFGKADKSHRRSQVPAKTKHHRSRFLET